MSKNTYSLDQIRMLLKNQNINNCTSKSITYTNEFKARAVQEYYQDGLSPNMIFTKIAYLEAENRFLKKLKTNKT